MTDEKEFLYRLPEDDDKEASILFAEMLAQYNDEHPDAKVVLFERGNPFGFGRIVRDEDGDAKAVRLTKEELEEALYKAGLFTLQTASEKVKQLFNKLFTSAEKGDVRGIDTFSMDYVEETDSPDKEECVLVLLLCVFSTMFLGYLYMFYQYTHKKYKGVYIK